MGQLKPELFVRKIKRRNARNKDEWRSYLKRLAKYTTHVSGNYFTRSRHRTWVQDRLYGMHYEPVFTFALKRFYKRPVYDLANELAALGKKNLTVLEDGAGQGIFLSDLRTNLRKLGITPRLIGLHAERRNPRLFARKKIKDIDELNRGLAEYFVPKKPVDVIFSLFGSIYYTPKMHEVDHILKFASSLKPGGIMLAGVDSIVAATFTRSTKREELQRLIQVKKVLTPRGFKVRVYGVPPHLLLGRSLPEFVLVVKRD